MKQVNVAAGVEPTKICDAGNRDFIHVFNNSDVVIYVGYDGDPATPLELATTNGVPLLPNAMLVLDNVGPRNIYTHAVYAVHGGSGSKDVRVQGD